LFILPQTGAQRKKKNPPFERGDHRTEAYLQMLRVREGIRSTFRKNSILDVSVYDNNRNRVKRV